MHRFLIFLLLVFASILLGVPAAWAQDDSPSEVTVPDAALRTVLEDSLGLAAGDPILATELAGLTVLDARHRYPRIEDLTGLEHATGLRRLVLLGNSISDLSPLAGLTGLAILVLQDNEISDLSPLAGLTGLTRLDLRGNEISDLSPLAGLTALTWLNLRGNEISDVTPLAGLTALQMLDLAHNSVADVSPLAGLTGLTALYVDQDVDLTPWPGRPDWTVLLYPRPKYPKLKHGLSRLVEEYEAALAAGRVTSRVGGGPCYGDLDEFRGEEFRNWDPSEPAPSIWVEIFAGWDVDQVTDYLGDHGIRCGSLEERLPCYVGGGRVVGCVPVPLLAALSELRGVEWIRMEPGAETDSPTLLGGVSWGAVKDRFR